MCGNPNYTAAVAAIFQAEKSLIQINFTCSLHVKKYFGANHQVVNFYFSCSSNPF